MDSAATAAVCGLWRYRSFIFLWLLQLSVAIVDKQLAVVITG